MNPSEHNELDDDQLLDLLVDGELSESQRRDLLRRLEQAPDGWRRCALAFLEAQCWKRELGGMAREPQAAGEPARPATALKGPRLRWPGLLVLAASLLIALGLGSLLRDLWLGPGRGRGEFAAGVSGPSSKAPPPEAVGTPAGRGPQVASPWQMVTLATDRGGPAEGQRIRLPAEQRERIDDDWLRSFPAAVPPEVLRALQNTGHEVRQSRQLLPLPMQDGRQLVVPLDQVELEYLGRPAY